MIKLKKVFILGIISILSFGMISCGSNAPTEKTGESVDNTPIESLNPSESTPSIVEHTHTFKDTWTMDENYHWHASTCNHDDSIVKIEHTFVESEKKDEPATFELPGKNYKKCSACGYETYIEIPIRVNESNEFDDQGNYIYLGFYPQTYVSDTNIITALDSLTEDLTTGFVTYNGVEYKKVVANPYERGYKFSDGTAIVKGETYYFKVELIKWKILTKNADGDVMLFSDKILDVKAYQLEYEKISEEKYYNTSPNVPENIYANNYQYSEIRSWLNNDFYKTTFTKAQQRIIRTTQVDNSKKSTGATSNPYVCENTNDKVFLLSYEEATNNIYGFSTDGSAEDTKRVKYGTDYAKAQGLYVYIGDEDNKASNWWFRSPNSNLNCMVRKVTCYGKALSIYVYESGHGVCPALYINYNES